MFSLEEIREKLNNEKIKFGRADDFMKALEEFLVKESFLLQKNLSERALTHKLAEYLQKYFPDYHVDCEYNRMPNGEKYDVKKIKTCSDDRKAVYPDIIIHKRGSNEANLLIIEVKRSCNIKENKARDIEKLKAFINNLNYKFGIYIEFNEEGVEDFKIYKKDNCV